MEFTIFKINEMIEADDTEFDTYEKAKKELKRLKKLYPNKIYIAEDVIRYMKP